MSSFLFWQRWLVGLCIAVSVFGLSMVFLLVYPWFMKNGKRVERW